MPNPEQFESVAPPFRAFCRLYPRRYALAHKWLVEWEDIVRQGCSVFQRALLLGILCLSMACPGCGKKSAMEQPVSSGNLLKADGQVDLEAFTLLLHRYVEHVNKVPTDVNEMVTRGFVPSLPAPPPGKRWAIERGAMDYRVIVVDK